MDDHSVPTLTPTKNNSSSDTDDYSPPITTAMFTARAPTDAERMLTRWIDSVLTGISNRKLTVSDFKAWQNFLLENDFKHDDFAHGLLYAVEQVVKGIVRSSDSANVGNMKGGIETGLPLTKIGWEQLNEDRCERLSTHQLKAGILDALEALHELNGRIAGSETARRKATGITMEVDSVINPDELVLDVEMDD